MSAWYRSGTIAVAGKTVTGTGTNWTDNKMGIGPGQALLIPGAGTVKVYEISRVDSATQLTLNDDAGTVAAGQAYAIMSFYSDSVPDFARRLSAQLSYYQAQMDGWQEIMTGTGSITLEAPDGTQVTVSSFKKLTTDMAAKADKTALDGKADKVDGAVPVSEGGTGSTTASGARKNLELGDSATRNVHTALYGDTAGVGVALQTNADFRNIVGYDDVQNFPRGVSGGIQDATKYGATGDYVGLLSVRGWGDPSAPSASWQIAVNSALQAFRIPIRAADGFSYLTTYKIWNQRNTTVDGNGFIKQASPIARLTSYPEIMPPTFTDGGFSLAGVAAVNLEAEGVTAERVDTGVYRVSGAFGIHPDGWTIEIPQDNNGNRLCFVETDVAADGVITVSVFKRRFDIDTAMIVAGDPMDIPPGRWIDLRLEMPVDSIFNQKMNAAEGAVSLSRQEQTDNS
ncbi:hypothetical protein QMS76_05560 [Cronobacter sakazakii]|uniref:phage tail fiber protein n=1 Tax=Cronobacter sakazakii TaxID=28141 RepID=UPI000A198027|nr:hypothetical protein [Cronobacter sakazakii]EMC4332172.1 hypothetical protein [Cronobacter sakazakii]MDK1113956.1 hypothetical protein [Cronobacter sakazakii]PUY68044.1 hypothetical protein B8W48_05725 [Cronobacter sakazakii]